MRRAGFTSAILLLLLARCGEPGRPRVQQRRPATSPEVAALSAPAVVPVAHASLETPRQPTRLEVVRELARRLGTPGCGARLLLDEAGQPLPGQERYQIRQMRALGPDAVGDCAFILADPNSEWAQVVGVCELARELKTGRRFVPLLVQRLATGDAMLPVDGPLDDSPRFLRTFLIQTLEELGDERDAWVLVRVLRRDEKESQLKAARALARIGGRPELETMSAWLALRNPNDPLVPLVRKCRDQLGSHLLANLPGKQF